MAARWVRTRSVWYMELSCVVAMRSPTRDIASAYSPAIHTTTAYATELDGHLSLIMWTRTHLDRKENIHAIRTTVLECKVARPITLLLFSFADECYTLCDEANDRQMNIDGLWV